MIKRKDNASTIKRSTTQDEYLRVIQADGESVFTVLITEEAGKQTLAFHVHSTFGGSRFNPTIDEARAVRDFLTEMLP